MLFESLHNHTTLSDGLIDHFQMLNTAQTHGFGTIAFTDHDALPDPVLLKQLHDYQGPVKWLLGCEISSGWPKELGADPASMFHVLGLFTNPTDTALLEHCRLTQEARRERMEQLVTNFTREGFVITSQDVLNFAGGESVAKPHIVSALMSHPENLVRLEYFIGELKKSALTNPEHSEIVKDAEQRCEAIGDKSQYFYPLFMTPQAYVPNVYVPYLYEVDMDAAVTFIRDAGGIAFIAHWGTVKKRIDEQKLVELVTSKRVDGIETRTGFVGIETDSDYAILNRVAEQTHCATEIGIDSHREEDFVRFIENSELATSTIGQTKRLIDQYNPDLQFSNL